MSARARAVARPSQPTAAGANAITLAPCVAIARNRSSYNPQMLFGSMVLLTYLPRMCMCIWGYLPLYPVVSYMHEGASPAASAARHPEQVFNILDPWLHWGFNEFLGYRKFFFLQHQQSNLHSLNPGICTSLGRPGSITPASPVLDHILAS